MNVAGALTKKAAKEALFLLLQAAVLQRQFNVRPQGAIVLHRVLKVMTCLAHHLQITDRQIVEDQRQDFHW